MELAISQANPSGAVVPHLQLLEKKKVDQQRNLQELAVFIGQTKAYTPNFGRFLQQHPWISQNSH